jgi:hypothetical protein
MTITSEHLWPTSRWDSKMGKGVTGWVGNTTITTSTERGLGSITQTRSQQHGVLTANPTKSSPGKCRQSNRQAIISGHLHHVNPTFSKRIPLKNQPQSINPTAIGRISQKVGYRSSPTRTFHPPNGVAPCPENRTVVVPWDVWCHFDASFDTSELGTCGGLPFSGLGS